ncbi:MAG TPA: permease [Patescibacteria group bacterium]|nr:permease [Patescibacteria group bacterium]
MIPANFDMWYGLLGLVPLVVYVVLIFTYKDPIPTTLIAVIIGAVITHQSVFSFGDALVKSMGSFLALVGLIIMLGRGLGEILTATKVSHTIVHKIVYGIGVNTEKKAMAGIIAASLTIVALLGTMAGGNAVIAPIVLPIAAAAGLTKSTVGVLFHAAGEEGLILGPFTPPVVTLLGLTGLAYGEMLLKAALPVAIVTLITTWFMAGRIQKTTKGRNDYEREVSENVDVFNPSSREIRATVVFILAFVILVGCGLVWNAQTTYVPVIMITLAVVTGLVGGLSLSRVFELFVKGMGANVNLFFMFLLLEVFMGFMEKAGAFQAVAILIQPLVHLGGKVAVPIIGGLTGAVGLTGATVAVMKMVNEMFLPLVKQYGIPTLTWATAVIVATRATNFFHPGSNMFSSMGFAQSQDMRSMIKNGWTVAFMQLAFLVIFSFLFT